MEESKLDLWFTNLRVDEKEHIASKIETKNSGVNTVVRYPSCTNVWLEQFYDRKLAIYIHCNKVHNFKEKEEKEGCTFSY